MIGIAIFFTAIITSDSMAFPVKGGKIVDDSFRSTAESHRSGVELTFDSDMAIYSCSSGIIRKISEDATWGKLIMVSNGDLSFSYFAIDSATVSLNDSIEEGQMIGIKKKSSVTESIFFSVYRNGLEQDALLYVRWRGIEVDTSNSCSSILNILSYNWKLDSLGTNGFRFDTFERILKSDLNNISVSFLFDKLGQPNQIVKSNFGLEYRYYYYDFGKMPKGFDGSPAIYFLTFKYSKYEKYAKAIEKGFSDY